MPVGKSSPVRDPHQQVHSHAGAARRQIYSGQSYLLASPAWSELALYTIPFGRYGFFRAVHRQIRSHDFIMFIGLS